MTNLPRIGLIADDFTGALDSGAQFSQSPLGVHLRFTGRPSGDVEIINTASREIPEAEAAARTQEACGLLQRRLLFKKIDSTLRGHVAAEIEAVLSAGPYRKALICSAAPLQGRSIRGGVLSVDGIPLEKTAFKDDPAYPARTSHVAELIDRPVLQLTLKQVRGPEAALAEAIRADGQRLITADAETHADLLALARACLAGQALPCGSFGLAKAVLEALEVPYTQLPAFRTRGRVLVLAGSASQVAREQVRDLDRLPGMLIQRLGSAPDLPTLRKKLDPFPRGCRVLVLCADQDQTVRSPEWLRFGKTVSETAIGLLDALQPATVLGVGGETVAHFCALLGTESIQVLGEAAPGIPFGRLHGGRLDGCLLVTKAGGFGGPGTLTDILSLKEET